MTIYSIAFTLILVMDPLGNIPVFISILRSVDAKRHNWIILREAFIAFLVLVAFLFFGQYIMDGLHITPSALGMAGGIILFLIAIRMIFPAHHVQTDEPEGEPFIVPLAIPLTAGPSSMAVVLLFASKELHQTMNIFLAILIASVIFTIVMLASRYLMKLLGQRGLIAMERLMGMLLTTLAVQMFLSGVQQYFNLNSSL